MIQLAFSLQELALKLELHDLNISSPEGNERRPSHHWPAWCPALGPREVPASPPWAYRCTTERRWPPPAPSGDPEGAAPAWWCSRWRWCAGRHHAEAPWADAPAEWGAAPETRGRWHRECARPPSALHGGPLAIVSWKKKKKDSTVTMWKSFMTWYFTPHQHTKVILLEKNTTEKV